MRQYYPVRKDNEVAAQREERSAKELSLQDGGLK